MNNTPMQSEGPVTTIVSRIVRPGHEVEFERWLTRIHEAAPAFPGYLGVHVMRPSNKAKLEYVSIFRFDCYANLKNFLDSETHKRWQESLPRDAVEGEAQTRRVSGLEFWFNAPDAPTLPQPPRHKMALVLVVVIFCTLSILTPLFAWLFASLNPKLRMLIVVTLTVLMMTYLVMPLVPKLLSRWLFAKSLGRDA